MGLPGSPPGNNHGDAVGDPVPVWADGDHIALVFAGCGKGGDFGGGEVAVEFPFWYMAC